MSEIKTYPLVSEKLILSGQYWIGDPCYIFSDEDWSKFCYEMFGTEEKKKNSFDDRNTVRVIDVDGELIYAFGTAYGDGEYPLTIEGNLETYLSVDAGILSIIPIKLLKRDNWKKENRNFGKIVSFNGEEREIYLKNGNLDFGDLSIITDFYIHDEYDDYGDYDEYGDVIE